MREIKFRAWDTKNDQMVKYEDMLLYDHQEISSFVMPLRGSYELMQYTGLKDKNGVEIYEADIVNYYAYSDGKNHSRRFVIEWHETTRTTGFNISRGHNLNQLERIEVVGNTYENGNLLK